MDVIALTGPYSWKPANAAVSIILRGPSGYCHDKFAQALSLLKEENPNTWRKDTNAFVWALNVTYSTCEQFPVMLQLGVDGARRALDSLITATGVPRDRRRDPYGRIWLKPKGALHRKLAEALTAIGKVTDVLAKHLYNNQDPSLVDPLMQEKMLRHYAAIGAGLNGKKKRDVEREAEQFCFRRIRIRGSLSRGPRMEDPRLGKIWLEAARRLKKSEQIIKLTETGWITGARGCSLRVLTVCDLLRRADKPGRVAAPSKNSDGERVLQLSFGSVMYAEFRAFVDRQLRRFYKTSLAKIEASPELFTDEDLDEFLIFTEDGKEPISRERLCRVFREVSIAAGLIYRDLRTGELKPFTFHRLRHEYIYRRLTRMGKMTPTRRVSERKAIIDYMGWAEDGGMLDWYSRHFAIDQAIECADEAAEELSGSAMLDQVHPMAPADVADLAVVAA